MLPRIPENPANLVWACLDEVMDPELDEAVTSMGFVESVSIDHDNQEVGVEFRLPTYWCSPNFAFLMSIDMRLEIERLNWVSRATVNLLDHCFADQINQGVNSGQEFSDVFAQYCNGEKLDDVRNKFLEKAFLRRQETLLLALGRMGFTHLEVVSLSLGELLNVTFVDTEENRQLSRYISLLAARKLSVNSEDRAFVTWQGSRLAATALPDYLSQCRAVRINMEFNGALCRGLKDARYKEVRMGPGGAVPVKFIRHPVSV